LFLLEVNQLEDNQLEANQLEVNQLEVNQLEENQLVDKLKLEQKIKNIIFSILLSLVMTFRKLT
jgi:hypothetical protein